MEKETPDAVEMAEKKVKKSKASQESKKRKG